MKIAKTRQEDHNITQFTKAMKEALNDQLYETISPLNLEGTDLQKLFEKVKDEIFTASGTLYLCFTCGSHFPRTQIKKQNFYQISGVWHDCLGKMNGYAFPTIGVITRWQIVRDYIMDSFAEQLSLE